MKHALMQTLTTLLLCVLGISAAHLFHSGCRRKILPAHRNAAGGHSAHAL